MPILNRRELATGFAASSLALLQVGCQSNQSLRLIGEDSSNLRAIQRELDRYASSGIKATADALDFDSALAQATTDLAQKTGRYDLILQYNFALSSFVRNHYVYSVTDLKKIAPTVDYSFEADLLENIWKELGYFARSPFNDFYDVEPIAYPFCANTMILVYNKEILSRPEIVLASKVAFGADFYLPRTWEEFVTAVRMVREAAPGLSGIALQGATGGWLYYEWINLLFGLGGKVMEKTFGWQSDLMTPLTLESSAATAAAELYLSMRTANAGDFYSVDAVAQRDLMLTGDVAYAIMWTDYVPEVAKRGAGAFGFAPVPGTKSMIAGGSYFVSRLTKYAAQAATLISHLSSPPVQKRMALDGLFPSTKSALSDPEINALSYMPAVRSSLQRGVYMAEAGPDSNLISQSITDAIQKAWRGNIKPAELAAAATAQITAGRRKL